MNKLTEDSFSQDFSTSTLMAIWPEDTIKELITGFSLSKIPEEVLIQGDKPGMYNLGRETQLHITIAYGMNSCDMEKVREVVEMFGPIQIEFGPVSFFRNGPESEAPSDVCFVKILSEELEALHYGLRELFEFSTKYPDYPPHMTLAYIKKGSFPELTGYEIPNVTGVKGSLGAIHFIQPDKSVEAIHLQRPLQEGKSPNYRDPYSYKQNKRETFDDVKAGDADMYLQKGFSLGSTQFQYALNNALSSMEEAVEKIAQLPIEELLGEFKAPMDLFPEGARTSPVVQDNSWLLEAMTIPEGNLVQVYKVQSDYTKFVVRAKFTDPEDGSELFSEDYYFDDRKEFEEEWTK